MCFKTFHTIKFHLSQMEEEKKMKKLEAAKKKQEQEVSLMVYIDSDLLRLCHQGNLHVSVTVADGETGQDEDPCK